MSARLRLVCRPELAPGFALTGLAPDVLPDGAPFEALWPRLAETGVVLLQEEIHATLPEEIRGRLDRSVRPLVIPVPGPAWQAAPSSEARVIELLRRAIGYRVKLR